MCNMESSACEMIHRILEGLPEHSSPKSTLPRNGLYFFYEDGEICAHTGKPRIIRVGNHPRSQNRLITRLREHYGQMDYPEKKNGSILRRLLGGAILRRRDPNHPCLLPSPGEGHWEKQGGKTCELCRPLENEVTELLKTSFRFRCIEIIPMYQRNEMERKLIATLARCHECSPSENWLGRWAYNEKVRRSGMWNSEYVDDEYEMTITDLEEMERNVKKLRTPSAT